MSAPSRFPILRLAAEALVLAARSVLPFFKIFWLPIVIYFIALAISRVAWFEHFGQQSRLPLWAEVVIWAPFGALISTAIFRYFDRGELTNWRAGVQFGHSFGVVVLLIFIVDMVYRYSYAGTWDLWAVQMLGRTGLGPNEVQFSLNDNESVAVLRFAVLVAGLAVNAVVGLLAMGLVWINATRDRMDFSALWGLLRLFPLSLFAYFLLVEIIYFQISALYGGAINWLGVPFPTGLETSPWRERIFLEILRELPYLPLSFVVNLIWYTAIVVAFRWLEGRSLTRR